MKSVKKTALILCVLLMIQGAVWAGGGREQAPAAGNQPVTLRFAWWGSQVRNDQTMQVVELFKQKNPGVEIECEFLGWGDYFNSLSTQIAGGTLPDLIQHDYAYIGSYVERGLLAPLDEYLGKEIKMDNIDRVNIAGGIVNGKLYGFNMGNNMFGIQCAEEIFEEHGIPLPSADNWDYEDFLNICRQFKAKGIYGCELSNFYEWVVYYLRANGQSLYSQTGQGLGYTDDKLVENIFQMRLDLVREGLMPSPDVALATRGWEDNLLTRGQAAMITYNSNAVSLLANASGYTMKSLPFFGPNADKSTFIKPSMFLSVSANSRHKDICAKLIDFFANDVDANRIMKGERGVPISSNIRNVLSPQMTVTENGVFELLAYAETHSGAIDKPDPQGSGECQRLLLELEEEVLYGRITPAQAAARLRREATSILTN